MASIHSDSNINKRAQPGLTLCAPGMAASEVLAATVQLAAYFTATLVRNPAKTVDLFATVVADSPGA